MKIGYFADGPWAHQALNKMLQIGGIQIGFIVGRYSNGGDLWLKNKSEELGVPYFIYQKINDSETIRELAAFKCELFISMSFDQIIKKDLLDVPDRGFINCHAGALPFYRGRNILNWALINGEKTYGVTVHFIDSGIDAGDIIRQKIYEISPDDDYRTLLEESFARCADVLDLALRDILNNQVKPIKQDSIDSVGSYFSPRKVGDEYLRWNWSAQRIHNFIRGITMPAPCARTFLYDKEYAIVKSRVVDNSTVSKTHYPGTVIAINNSSVVVSTGEGAVEIELIADCEGLKIKNIRAPDFSIGARFHFSLSLEVNP